MQHFPIFLNLRGARVVLSGGGETALAKLRLILKSEAAVTVFAADPVAELEAWAAEGRLTLERRPLAAGDAAGAALVYAANDAAEEDGRVAAIGRAEGALVNIVDNLEDSAFITPAIVDRDPVTVAIGTEGAAPVLARAIKADLEARLPVQLGALARIGKAFRHAAEALPFGRKRRDFWRDYYFAAGPRAIEAGDSAVTPALHSLLDRHLADAARPGRVDFVGAGPGDPEMLTLKARKLIDEADVIVHDRLIAPEILELARREAQLVEMGKEGFGPSASQGSINDTLVAHARDGAQVVRLKSGDPTVFGRLDEEIEACDAAGIDWAVIPGITAASAAVAAIGQSLTRRSRNSTVRFLTGHDMAGFAEHDWQGLARPGEVAAIYMGKRSARFVQGRLLMHGAAADTPVTVVENASRSDQRIHETTLGRLEPMLSAADPKGPALILFGLAPRAARAVADDLQKEIAL